MKLILTISAMILFLITGCESGKQPANDFLTVDITANYPKKELILQDFLDVEYIPLETNEEFITSASMQAIGKNLIILRNKNGQDGDIFIFDRTGKGQRKINRSGQGSQEYTNIGSIALDEEKGELFINNYYSSQFIVYDLSGNFKRTLKYDKDFNFNSGKIYNFDQDNLICYDEIGNYKNLRKSAFWLLSKQDALSRKSNSLMSIRYHRFYRKDSTYPLYGPGSISLSKYSYRSVLFHANNKETMGF